VIEGVSKVVIEVADQERAVGIWTGRMRFEQEARPAAQEAQLVATEKVGRACRCTLVPDAFEGISTWLQRLDRFRAGRRTDERSTMNETTVTTPNELEIRVERVFDAPRAHVSVWTGPQLIPEWWGDGEVVEELDLHPGGASRFCTSFGVVEGEFREVEPPGHLVQTFQNHRQTLEFEALGEQTKLTQTMRFATTEERDTTMQYGVEEGAKNGFAQIDALIQRLTRTEVLRNG
jgi:uncharacterized protein YndB with AHSA1/START domain